MSCTSVIGGEEEPVTRTDEVIRRIKRFWQVHGDLDKPLFMGKRMYTLLHIQERGGQQEREWDLGTQMFF